MAKLVHKDEVCELTIRANKIVVNSLKIIRKWEQLFLVQKKLIGLRKTGSLIKDG